MKNPVGWFEIYVNDMGRAKKFYETLLEVKLDELVVPPEMDESNEFHMLSFPFAPDAPNASGALVKGAGVEPGGNSVMIYFACQECSIEEGRVESAGGKVLKPKFSIGEYGFCSICLDTEGNTFGLHSME